MDRYFTSNRKVNIIPKSRDRQEFYHMSKQVSGVGDTFDELSRISIAEKTNSKTRGAEPDVTANEIVGLV